VESLRTKIIDSALILTIISAVLYFLGSTVVDGEAYAYDVPSSILREDLWPTLIGGAETIYLIPNLLFLFTNLLKADWILLCSTLFLPLIVFITVFLSKRIRFRNFLLGLLVVVAFSSVIKTLAEASARDSIQKVRECLGGIKCTYQRDGRISKVTIQLTDGALKSTVVGIVSATPSYWVLVTIEGITVVPSSSIKLVETTREFTIFH
jgi:hypothetical protein